MINSVTQKWLMVIITHPYPPPKEGIEVFLRNLIFNNDFKIRAALVISMRILDKKSPPEGLRWGITTD